MHLSSCILSVYLYTFNHTSCIHARLCFCQTYIYIHPHTIVYPLGHLSSYLPPSFLFIFIIPLQVSRWQLNKIHSDRNGCSRNLVRYPSTCLRHQFQIRRWRQILGWCEMKEGGRGSWWRHSYISLLLATKCRSSPSITRREKWDACPSILISLHVSLDRDDRSLIWSSIRMLSWSLWPQTELRAFFTIWSFVATVSSWIAFNHPCQTFIQTGCVCFTATDRNVNSNLRHTKPPAIRTFSYRFL